jgi:hypothetical protein
MTIEVKIPTSAKGLRIRHFNSMSMLPEEGFDNAQDGLVFLSDFLGLRYNQVLDFTKKDVEKMLEACIKAFTGLDLISEVPKELILDGQKFYLVDPDKVGIGWHIDFSKQDIVKAPVRLACLFYLPEGFNYSDVDVNGNITQPIDSRVALFEEHFPLELFIRAAGFFLKKLLESEMRSTVLSLAKNKQTRSLKHLKKILNLSRGKSQ